MKKTLPTLLAVAFVAIAFSNCNRTKTVAERAEEAAIQAKAQTDPSAHAAIDEAKRIAAETGRPVDVKVTQRIDVSQPEVIPPPPVPTYVPPPAPGTVVVEPIEPERTPGQAIDNALQRAGKSLQRLGEKIEDKSEQ